MIEGMGSVNPFMTAMRRSEGELKATYGHIQNNPLDLNNQVAFHNALMKKGQTVAAATNWVSQVHNCQRTIINSF